MSKLGQAAAAAFVLAAIPAAHAAGIGKGDFEAGVSIGVYTMEISYTQDFGFGDCETTSTTDAGTIGMAFGYFITDMIELKGAASATRSGSEIELSGAGCGPAAGTSGTPAETYGILSPGADFVFLGRSGKVAPFVGAAYGLGWGDTPGGLDTDYYDLHGGVKLFLTERAAMELKLTRFEPTESAAGGRTELAAGINVYF